MTLDTLAGMILVAGAEGEPKFEPYDYTNPTTTTTTTTKGSKVDQKVVGRIRQTPSQCTDGASVE